MIFNFEIKEYSDRKVAVCSNCARLTTVAYETESLRDNILLETLKLLEIKEARVPEDIEDLYDGDSYTLDCTEMLKDMEIH